jgi:hypothetical protein
LDAAGQSMQLRRGGETKTTQLLVKAQSAINSFVASLCLLVGRNSTYAIAIHTLFLAYTPKTELHAIRSRENSFLLQF